MPVRIATRPAASPREHQSRLHIRRSSSRAATVPASICALTSQRSEYAFIAIRSCKAFAAAHARSRSNTVMVIARSSGSLHLHSRADSCARVTIRRSGGSSKHHTVTRSLSARYDRRARIPIATYAAHRRTQGKLVLARPIVPTRARRQSACRGGRRRDANRCSFSTSARSHDGRVAWRQSARHRRRQSLCARMGAALSTPDRDRVPNGAPCDPNAHAKAWRAHMRPGRRGLWGG